MTRPPRIDFPDALYHVTNRGSGRADIFFSDDDRQRFLGQLAHHLHLIAHTCARRHVPDWRRGTAQERGQACTVYY